MTAEVGPNRSIGDSPSHEIFAGIFGRRQIARGDFVRRRTKGRVGPAQDNPSRGDFWACCPFHNEKTPSFHVEDRKGRYHCFGCKASGDIFTFLVEKEGLSFPRRSSGCAGSGPAGAAILRGRRAAREAQSDPLRRDGACGQILRRRVAVGKGSPRARLSCRSGTADCSSTGIPFGYAPDDRSALRSFLAAKDITVEQMAEAGLVISGDDIPVAYDRFRDRVMFPINDARGRAIAFGGRALAKDAQAKYLNSPETPLFHKGRVLYNLDKARGPAHETQEIIAVEGYMDTIAMHRAGLPQTVAPLGTALTEDQLALLWRIAPEPTLCFDGDEAGIKAARRAMDWPCRCLLPAIRSNSRSCLKRGPRRSPDPCRSGCGEGGGQGGAALADLLWAREAGEARTDTPDGRAAFEVKLSALIGGIGDVTVRKYYAEDFRRRIAEHMAPAQGRPLASADPDLLSKADDEREAEAARPARTPRFRLAAKRRPARKPACGQGLKPRAGTARTAHPPRRDQPSRTAPRFHRRTRSRRDRVPRA